MKYFSEEDFPGCVYDGAIQTGLILKNFFIDDDKQQEFYSREYYTIKGISEKDKSELFQKNFKTLCVIDGWDNFPIFVRRINYSSPTYLIGFYVFVHVENVKYQKNKISTEIIFTSIIDQYEENAITEDSLIDEIIVVILQGYLEIDMSNGKYFFETKSGILAEKSDTIIKNLFKLWS